MSPSHTRGGKDCIARKPWRATLLDEETKRRRKSQLEAEIKSDRRATLIVNTRARRGQRAYAEARRRLAEKGFLIEADFPVRDPARMPEIVAMSIAQGRRFIIVGGGDGTISSVADAFAGRDVVFGLLPLGTANSFARTLGIPLNLAGAIDVLADGKVVDVDLGRVDGDYFANAVAIGLAAGIARSVPHGLKKAFGRAGYLIAAAALLPRFQPFRCTITPAGGAPRRFEDTLEVRVANGPYKGGVLVAREASLESRRLMVHVVKGRSTATLAKVWWRLSRGRTPDPAEMESFSAEAFAIETEPRQYVSIDGEAVTRTPVRVDVVGDALMVMAPRNRTDLT